MIEIRVSDLLFRVFVRIWKHVVMGRWSRWTLSTTHRIQPAIRFLETRRREKDCAKCAWIIINRFSTLVYVDPERFLSVEFDIFQGIKIDWEFKVWWKFLCASNCVRSVEILNSLKLSMNFWNVSLSRTSYIECRTFKKICSFVFLEIRAGREKRFAKKVRIIGSLERGHREIQMELPVAQNLWRALAVVD